MATRQRRGRSRIQKRSGDRKDGGIPGESPVLYPDRLGEPRGVRRYRFWIRSRNKTIPTKEILLLA
jgi:hypothetical protein